MRNHFHLCQFFCTAHWENFVINQEQKLFSGYHFIVTMLAMRISSHGTEEQWEQRNRRSRGTVGTEEQRNRGTEGTEEQKEQ